MPLKEKNRNRSYTRDLKSDFPQSQSTYVTMFFKISFFDILN